MIKSFLHMGLDGFFLDGDKDGIQTQHAQRITDVLYRLDSSIVVQDMNFLAADCIA